MITMLPPQQIEVLRDLWLELHQHHARLPLPAGFRVRDPQVAWEDWTAATRSAIEDREGAILAHHTRPSRSPTGFAVVLMQEHYARPLLEPTGPLGELDTIVIAPDHRGHRIGEALYGAATAWLRGRGAVAMTIPARATNDSALRFYRRSGATDAFTIQIQTIDLSAPTT